MSRISTRQTCIKFSMDLGLESRVGGIRTLQGACHVISCIFIAILGLTFRSLNSSDIYQPKSMLKRDAPREKLDATQTWFVLNMARLFV